LLALGADPTKLDLDGKMPRYVMVTLDGKMPRYGMYGYFGWEDAKVPYVMVTLDGKIPRYVMVTLDGKIPRYRKTG
jgi:hypothetical protein